MTATRATSSQPYRLTVKRGFLALLIMFTSQTLVGLGLSFGLRFVQGTGTIGTQMIGLISVLVGGTITLIWVWTDICRFGPSFLPQIGLGKSIVKASQTIMLVLLLLIATHFLAWIYRTILLPIVGHSNIIGGGSQMFAYIRESGSLIGRVGFFVLALIVGPVMEEVIFRGYLQSALTQRLPGWSAILITSLLFMLGHGPTILWPMYFIYSVAWGWIFMHSRSLKMAIAIHMLTNLFYAVIAIMGWKILA